MIPSGVPPPCRDNSFDTGYALGYYLYITVPFFRVRGISLSCSTDPLLSIGGPKDCKFKTDPERCESTHKIQDTMGCRGMQ